ncbi:hypothetical protein G7054_g13630 [Neopestalotiopsis clavispora]|nr:hypothetical protein G7054_g13630 [Neopestalotiopsis clavispora]
MANEESTSDEIDLESHVKDQRIDGPHSRKAGDPHFDAIQGNSPLIITVEHAPADPRRSSRLSFTSDRSISDRGEALYEQSLSDHYSPLIRPPKSGKKSDLQAALYAEQVSMEGGKQNVYKCFYPRGSLDQLITPQIVYDSICESIQSHPLQTMDSERITQYAERVCGTGRSTFGAKSFKKMFAILLLADAPGLIINFVDEDLNDSDLPLSRTDSVSDHRSFQRSLHRRSQPGEPIQCLENWSIPGRTSFYSYQWTTIAPFFANAARARRINIYKLSDEDILPWTKKYAVREYGGYSKVYRVAIHRSHHEFGNRKDTDGTFAVKKLRYEEVKSEQPGTAVASSSAESRNTTESFEERARQQFRDEVEVLQRFSNDAHTHLISLLAAFQRGRSCYLLFDWAHSDLLQFWKKTMPGPPLEKRNVKWLIDQMHGIAEGLYRIHTYRLSGHGTHDPALGLIYGRHGDIKPQNFLIFKKENQSFQESVIKLTDFGLTRFHSETSRSGIRQSKITGFTPSYRPPELDLEGATISRSFDVWSLGCVFLEFITWHFGGWSYLHAYVLKRMWKDIISGHKTDQFFEFVQNEKTEEYGLRIKFEVLQWISDLHKRSDCSNLMHDVLDFIQTRMLAVIPASNNTDQSHTRAKIEEVLQNFQSFKERAGDPDYSLKGRSKTTYVDGSAISVNMTLEASKKDELRKDLFEVRRGDQEYKVTTRRTQTGF